MHLEREGQIEKKARVLGAHCRTVHCVLPCLSYEIFESREEHGLVVGVREHVGGKGE